MKVTLPDGGVDLHCSPAEPGQFEWSGVSFDGTTCLVRLDAEGVIHSCELVQGKTLEREGDRLVG